MRRVGNEPLATTPRPATHGAVGDRKNGMARFITLTFLLLGWSFYEASGGAEFTGTADASHGAPLLVGSLHDVPEHRLAHLTGTAAGAALADAAPDPLPVEVVARAHMDFDAPLGPVLATLPADAPVLEAPIDMRAVDGGRVNMRSGPGTGHGVVAVLSRGDRTEVLEEDGGWVRVRAADGTAGWMSARLLADI